jgi:hypothetical protein
MYCSSLEWVSAGHIAQSPAHVATDVVHLAADAYGFVVMVSRHVLHSSFRRFFQQQAFFQSLLIFPQVFDHESLLRRVFNVTTPADRCTACDGTLLLNRIFKVETLNPAISLNAGIPSITIYNSRIISQLFF